MNKTIDIVYLAMKNIGEESELETIYAEVHRIDPGFPNRYVDWKSVICSAIYSHSSDVEKFWTTKKLQKYDVFKLNGERQRKGKWSIRSKEADCWSWVNPATKYEELKKTRSWK